MNNKLMILAVIACAGSVLANPRESQSVPGQLLSDDTGSAFSLTFTNSDGGGSYTALRVHLTGTLTSSAPGTYASEVVLDVTPPGGALQSIFLGVAATYVTNSFDVTRILDVPAATGGTWSFQFRETYQDLAGTPDSLIDGLVVELDDSDGQIDLGTLVDGTPVSVEVVLGASEVKWYKVVIADVSTGAHRKLDINTLSSAPGGDTEIGLYSSIGAGLWTSDDAGGGLFSQLTFGEEGTLGDLAAGTYFIPVSSYNAAFFVPSWNVNSIGPGGTFQLTVSQTVITPPVGIWDEAVDGGGDAGQDLGTAQVVTGTGDLPRIVGSFGVDDVDLYKINICDTANFSATTLNTAPAIDTQLFLFDASGMGVVMNDDNPAGTGGTWSRLDASSGLVTAAGDYYLAVSRFDIDPTSGGIELWLDQPYAAQRAPDGAGAGSAFDGWLGSNVTTGNYRIDFTGVCHTSGGNACGASDIGSVGGAPGADAHLDNNDFVVFIDYFFSHNPIADMGSTGGAPGADGAWDNNDFVVFIDNFFTAPASCR